MEWKRPINDIKLINQSEKKLLLIYNSLIRNRNKLRDLSLYSGRMGICLFFCYYELYRNKKGIAKRMLYEINDTLLKKTNDFNYILWFSEFGWLLQHLRSIKFVDFEIDEIIAELDEVLTQSMIYFLNQDKYELIYGATNIANYFLHRNSYSKQHFFDLYIETLHKKAIIINKNKIAWESYVDIATIRKNNEKHINLGLAHGIPALILFFCKLKEHNYNHKYLNDCIIKSCNFLLSVENNHTNRISHFSSVTKIDNISLETSRIGWCYGDLSVGFALLKASKYYPEIKIKCLEILYDTIKREDTAYDFDDCFCHGTFGNAHIYNRIFSLTNDENYKKAAMYWYEKGINRKCRNNCVAGIGFYNGKKNSYVSNLCLLDGIAGIGLSIISAISDITPLWDECFLLS